MSGPPEHRSRRTRSAAGLPPVTATQIVDGAVHLTAASGIENWTLRRLAASLDCYPTVIYHHVGDREAVVAAVVEAVVARIPHPIGTRYWREWFEVLLTEMRSTLRRYPGTARRLATVGPSVTAAGGLIDTGVVLLQEAGFGSESVLTYNMLTTVTCQLVAIEDERDATRTPRAGLAPDYLGLAARTDQPGLRAVGEFLHGLAERPGGVEGYYASFFEYTVQRCLDGAEARLTRLL